MKIGSVGFDERLFGKPELIRFPEDVTDDLDLLVLWGGSDVSPKYYGQVNIAAIDPDPRRDKLESQIVNKAVRLGIPMLGICRGSQFLCVMDGGTLWQHVENHAGIVHDILVGDKFCSVTSTHHQMMRPSPDAVVLGVATPSRSFTKVGERGPVVDHGPEPEIVYFPKLKALGIQGHPEYVSRKHPFSMLTFQLVGEYLNVAV